MNKIDEEFLSSVLSEYESKRLSSVTSESLKTKMLNDATETLSLIAMVINRMIDDNKSDSESF